MADKKIYSAFISSAFENLRDSRNATINALLDHRILPIGMEHFTVSTNGNFSDIEELIDDSDIFVLLLGDRYGSIDEKEGKSWTEKEFDYASKKNKHIIAIICPEFVAMSKKAESERTEDENRQIKFVSDVGFAKKVESNDKIATVITQFFAGFDFSKCIGWTRVENLSADADALEKWRAEHRPFDISGLWHHVHLSEEDESYMRIGTITITQDFSPNKYLNLAFKGENFGVMSYDQGAKVLRPNRMQSSQFVGDYSMQENGEIFGIFRSRRTFSKGEFNGQQLSQGERRGIHDFRIDVYNDVTTYIEGEFHDEAPSPKQGRIFMFRSEEERNEFLLEQREPFIKIQ